MSHRDPYPEAPSGGILLYMRLTGGRMVEARLAPWHCLDEVAWVTEHMTDLAYGYICIPHPGGMYMWDIYPRQYIPHSQQVDFKPVKR